MESAATESLESHDEYDDEYVEREPIAGRWLARIGPKGLALAGFALALTTLIGLSPVHEMTAVIAYSTHAVSGIRLYWVDAAGQGLVALLSGMCCVWSIRQEHEESDWSGGVARAGLLVAALSIVLSIATVLTVVLTHDRNGSL